MMTENELTLNDQTREILDRALREVRAANVVYPCDAAYLMIQHGLDVLENTDPRMLSGALVSLGQIVAEKLPSLPHPHSEMH